mgnify:FL=1
MAVVATAYGLLVPAFYLPVKGYRCIPMEVRSKQFLAAGVLGRNAHPRQRRVAEGSIFR